MKNSKINTFFKENFYNLYFSLLFISFLFILIYNILHYDPILGYDAEAHYAYIDSLSRYLPREIRIPIASETREFFNPPLAYIFPSAIQIICRNFSTSQNLLESCKPIYGNLTQIFQTIIYILSILINLLTLKIINKKKFNSFSISYLLLSMLLAVNYRSISMIRGEPYILLFLSFLIFQLVKLENNNFNFTYFDQIKLGFIIGLLALSRQWAFLLFPALFFISIKLDKKNSINYLKKIFTSFFIGFLISGWFYIYNFIKYKSFIPFNIDKTEFNYITSILNLFSLKNTSLNIFVNPIRPVFNNQFFPIFYSDTWGDYWGYFVFTSRFLEIGKDQDIIGQILGRANLLNVFTTLLIIIGFFYRYKFVREKLTILFIRYSIIFSFIGFIWFVLNYPTSSGDTIKAVYFVQVLNLMIFLTAIFIDNIKNKRIYSLIIISLTIIFVLNFPTYLSKFPIGFPY